MSASVAGMGNGVIPGGLTYRPTEIVRGSFKKKPYLMPLNEADLCLWQDSEDWDDFVANGNLQNICCPMGRPKYKTKPWVAMPKEGRRFKPVGIFHVGDLTQDLPSVVMSQRVPLGYNGVITDIVCEVLGANTGFMEGSGDLVWRLSTNQRYLRDLGNVKVSLGSLVTPSPIPRGGLLVLSDNLVEWSVTIDASGLMNINPDARVVCSITGWWYPR